MRSILILALLTFTTTTQAFAAPAKVVKFPQETAGLLRALADAKVSRDFDKAMAAGNTVSNISASINQDIRDASEITYVISTRHCFENAPERCIGGARLEITAHSYFVGNKKVSDYQSKLMLVR